MLLTVTKSDTRIKGLQLTKSIEK